MRSIYASWGRGDFSSVEWAHPEIEFVTDAGPASDVSMTEYAFKPKDLTVSKGDWIIVKNRGQIPHNYSLKGGQEEIGPTTGDVDPGSGGKVRPGDVTQVTSGDLPLTYDVICTIPGHAEKGMKGTLDGEVGPRFGRGCRAHVNAITFK
ncbi:MAG TPA: plastocyanin/azurin family copper-binding protein [Acidimicrobiia bacterium]|nr:plastocyanin/azurin family copper-binding protein [Acidimicrobiia bacterium]